MRNFAAKLNYLYLMRLTQRIALILLLILSSTSAAVAQTLSGRVVDSTAAPLSLVNVVRLAPADSSFLAGTTTADDGTFTLSGVQRGDLLRISYVGYETLYATYEGQASLTVTLREASEMLGAAVVRSSLPRTTLSGEGMQTTVEGTVLEKASSMEQLLQRIPRLSAQDGKIEVFGRGAPVVYINGRKMQDAMELQRLQPSDIKKIEVITNPGARYEASTKCVLRITTKRRQGEGFSFSSKTSFSLYEDADLTAIELFQANYRKGGLDLSAFLYGASTHQPDDKKLTQLSYLASTWRQTSDVKQQYENLNPYAKLSVSYMFDEENSLGASVSYDRYARNHGEGSMTFQSAQNDVVQETSVSEYVSPAQSTAYYANAYYVGKLGPVGIDFNTDYYWYGKKERNNVSEHRLDVSDPDTSFVSSLRRNQNSLLASKLVLSVPLWKGSLEVGGEYSSMHRRMRYNVVPEVTDDENEKVRETMSSAFVSYGRKFGPLAAQIGLRYEHVDFNYYSAGTYVPAQSKTYANWFPTLALSLPVGQTQMQLTYATDIYRPSYNELRSGVQYDNQYTYESGNPFLLPSLTRNLSYAFSWRWLNAQLVYSRASDAVCYISQTYRGDPLKTLISPQNINDYSSLQASLSLSPTFGLWSPSLTLMLSKQWLRMETHVGNRIDNPLAVFQLTNTFDFKFLTASLLLVGKTEGNVMNNYLRRGYIGCDLSLYKSLLRDRLRLTLDACNLFGSGNQYAAFYCGPQRTILYDVFNPFSISLGIRYSFNTAASKYKGTGAGASQRSRM